MAGTSVATAELLYDAKLENLSGTIGDEQFDITAYSGGSRGHSVTSKALANQYLHSDASSMFSHFANTVTVGHGTAKSPYRQRGGTLPPGHYTCKYLKNHPPFGECIFLERGADTHIHYWSATGVSLDNRGNDFFIHGHGPKGSDGCIVPEKNADRLRLNKAIKDFAPGTVTLKVKNVAFLLPAERDDIAIA